MAHYSLFIPNVQGSSPDHLNRLGLDDLMREGAPEFGEVIGASPSGGRGVFATWSCGNAELDPHPGFDPKRQEWTPCAPDEKYDVAKGDFWIGHEPERPVRPLDICYKDQLAGYPIQLLDDQMWFIPKSDLLPGIPGINGDTGEFETSVDPKFAGYCDRATEYGRQMYSALTELYELQTANPGSELKQSVTTSMKGLWEFAIEALSLNYRVTWQIVEGLKRLGVPLLDNPTMTKVVFAATEMLDVERVATEKKNEDTVSILVG